MKRLKLSNNVDLIECNSIKGVEFDWYCCDRNGNVGCFSSGGFGTIPASLKGVSEELLDEADSCLEALSPKSEILKSVDLDLYPCIGEWLSLTKLGFYAFDWSIEANTYDLLAVPSIPIKYINLPNPIRVLCDAVGARFECSFDDNPF